MPVLHVADPELIKAIMVKDFHLFVNRHKLMKAGNSVTKHNLNHLTGEEWKRVRAIVSPTFSSGKMRQLCARVRECATRFTKHLHVMYPLLQVYY